MSSTKIETSAQERLDALTPEQIESYILSSIDAGKEFGFHAQDDLVEDLEPNQLLWTFSHGSEESYDLDAYFIFTVDPLGVKMSVTLCSGTEILLGEDEASCQSGEVFGKKIEGVAAEAILRKVAARINSNSGVSDLGDQSFKTGT